MYSCLTCLTLTNNYEFSLYIQAIQKNNHGITGDRFTKLLEVWLQSSLNPTWSDLVKALRSSIIGRPDIADEIEDKYIKSDDFSVQKSKDTAGE